MKYKFVEQRFILFTIFVKLKLFFQVWGYSRVSMKAGITPFVVFDGSPLPAMANDDEIRRR